MKNTRNDPAWVKIVGTNIGQLIRFIIGIAIAIPVARLFGADI